MMHPHFSELLARGGLGHPIPSHEQQPQPAHGSTSYVHCLISLTTRDCYPHFTDGHTKVQRGKATGPKPHSNGAIVPSRPGSADPNDHAHPLSALTNTPLQRAPQMSEATSPPSPCTRAQRHTDRLTECLGMSRQGDKHCSHDRWPAQGSSPTQHSRTNQQATRIEPPGSATIPANQRKRAHPFLGPTSLLGTPMWG